MKNILMVIPFFPPVAGGGAFRPLGFVRYLEKFGWKPTVIAPRAGSFWISDKTLISNIPASCEVIRTNSLSAQRVLSFLRGLRGGSGQRQVRSSPSFAFFRRLGSVFLFPDTYIGWYPFGVRAGAEILRKRKFDAIYSTSPPETSHLIAHRLHKMSGLPWVADFRDPWMNLHLYRPPTTMHARLHRRLEKEICRLAGIVVTNRWHYELMKGIVPGKNRLEIIPNGYDRQEILELADITPKGDRFRILHAGMLTQKRSAEPFLRGLKRFIEQTPGCRNKVVSVFLGARESRNEELASELDLGGVVEFRDSVSHAEALRLERASHVLLLLKHLSPAYEGMVPGKVYEYIGVGRPVLALVPEGEVRELIKELKRGEVAAQEDEEQIAESIRRLYDKFLAGRLETDYALSFCPRYEREQLTGELAEFLDSLAR